MNSRIYTMAIIIILLICLVSISCRKAVRNTPIDNTMMDTTSMSVDLPEDSLSNGNFSLTGYDTPPTPIQNPMPAYPVKYKKSGIQGVVVLDVEVLENGTVGNVKVMKSLLPEPGALDDAAVNAVKNWIFKPALQGKKPVVANVNVPISFTLKN